MPYKLKSVDPNAPRSLAPFPLQFGDLSALAGDFTKTPDDLRQLHQAITKANGGHPTFVAIRRQWGNTCRWLHNSRLDPTRKRTEKQGDLDDCISAYLAKEDEELQRELISPPTEKMNSIYETASAGYRPSRKELAEFEQMSGYASLASHNRDHFPAYSWRAYATHHMEALKHARCYASLSAIQNSAPNGGAITNAKDCIGDHKHHLSEAILYEGFAQHFLQDSFSSGHVGSMYSECLTDNSLFDIPALPPLWCNPNKDYLQYTHDSLNGLGIVVRVMEPPTGLLGEYGEPQSSDVPRRVFEVIKEGWTAFGDDHLLIPEAALHRRIVIAYATFSIREVLLSAQGASMNCELCRSSRFPQLEKPAKHRKLDVDLQENTWFPNLKLWSTGTDYYDARLPTPTLEGWKVLATYGTASKTPPVDNLFDVRRPSAIVSAATFELGYVRNTDWWKPNYLGIGVFYAPGAEIVSVYPLSFGWWFSAKSLFSSNGCTSETSGICHWVMGDPVTFGLRINLGLQSAEGNTKFNLSPTRSVLGEMTFVGDIRISIYGPLAIYFRTELFRVTGTTHLSPNIESGFSGGTISSSAGVSYDLTGIF
ncbi:MAG: hypothetical protein HOO98_20315 [Nitrospira sp.]|nr:hypothetical protein [Nitrospira sp.]